MILTPENMMRFKEKYTEALSTNSRLVRLTPYEARNRDYWAKRVFGNAEYSFMFDVLIPNIDHALEYGYEIIK